MAEEAEGEGEGTGPIAADGWIEVELVEADDDDIGDDVVTGRLRLPPLRSGMSGPLWPQPATTADAAAANMATVAARKAILRMQSPRTAKLFDCFSIQ